MPAPADLGPASTDPANAEPGPQRRRRWRRGLTETAITLLVAAVLSVLLRAYAGEIFWVPSASMVPTLAVYDRILVQKAFFNWHDVREGDIVVFTHPPLDQCGGVPAGTSSSASLRCQARRSTPLATPSTSTGTCWPSRTCRLRPARPADRKQPASLPRPARRVLRLGRQPRRLLRQPLLGAHPGLQHHRQGNPGHLAQQPSRPPRPLTRGPSDIAEFPGHGFDCALPDLPNRQSPWPGSHS